MIPRLRVRRAGALGDRGASDMPSAPLGLESRPPIVEFTTARLWFRVREVVEMDRDPL
jgi:hypothetical protein